ncbi:MAG: Subtilisin DY [Dehalococcoidia bacterium]|nr:Subtilisin DY [Bacillota bacterium]
MKKGIGLGITVLMVLLLLAGSGAAILAEGSSLPGDARDRPEIQDLESKIDGLLEAEIRGRPGEKIPIIIVLEPGQEILLPEAEDVEELPSINAIAATVPAEGIKAIAALPGVEMVWLDEKIELILPEIDEAAAPAGWFAAFDYGDADIGAPALWKAGYKGKGIRIAIIDTGIDKYHPDFGDRVIVEKDFTEGIDWRVSHSIEEGETHEFSFAFRDTTDLVVELWWEDPENDLGLFLVEPDGVTTHTGTDPLGLGNFKQVTIAAPVDGWHPGHAKDGLWTFLVIGDAVETEIYLLEVAYHSAWDAHGHGTHVGGIAAGAHNPDAIVPVGWPEVPTATPVYGVAPEASLLNAKVFTRGAWTRTSWLIASVEWSVVQEADILNLSLGARWQADGTGRQPLELALTAAVKAGSIVVNSAGNSGPGEATIGSPALAHGIITVAASYVCQGIIFFSSRGPGGDGRFALDLAAPGVFVVAPVPLHRHILGYAFWHGTSMSAPHVAGAAALLLQAHPGLTPAEVERALKNSADDLLVSLLKQGAGRLDVADAHDAILGGSLMNHEWSVERVLPGVHMEIFTVINKGTAEVTLDITVAGMTNIQGFPVGDWVTAPATVTVPAGGTATFEATMTVPLDAVGIYVGGITLTTLASPTHIIVPVSVMVMQPLVAPFTLAEATGTVDETWDWVFYTLEVGPGITSLTVELDWTDQDNVLALLIFNPVGELVVWEWGPPAEYEIALPASGKWTVAIVAWHLPGWHRIDAPYIPVTYTLTSVVEGVE